VVIALSTTEVEYMAATHGRKEVYGFKGCVQESGLSREL
jgi:hypothetical protein